MAQPKIEPKAEPSVTIRSLADVANLAGDKRDMKLKAQIRQFVRPVRLEPGKLEIVLSPESPKTLVNDLSLRLKEWTGINWLVILSREPGGLTLIENDAKDRDDRVADARADPDVAAILSRFPGAKIIDVRISATDNDSDEADDVVIETDPGEDNE
jgi:DNA polymerase-3 subunit gamma/tau